MRVAEGDGLTLTVTGPFADAVGDGDNLVLRAARALAGAAGCPADAALTLDKHIPVAAGLGGGSADAAATLRLLNRFWRLDWPLGAARGGRRPARRRRAGVRVQPDAGRDGAGRMRCRRSTSRLAGVPVLLVNPRVAVPTGPVFAAWDRVDLGPLDLAAWRAARNDLTAPAIGLAPAVGDVLAALEATGARSSSACRGRGRHASRSIATRNAALQRRGRSLRNIPAGGRWRPR